jgi:hypothetical protein
VLSATPAPRLRAVRRHAQQRGQDAAGGAADGVLLRARAQFRACRLISVVAAAAALFSQGGASDTGAGPSGGSESPTATPIPDVSPFALPAPPAVTGIVKADPPAAAPPAASAAVSGAAAPGAIQPPAADAAAALPVRERLIFPAHVLRALAATQKEKAFLSPLPPGTTRSSFHVLGAKRHGAAHMATFKSGTIRLIHGDAAEAEASVAAAVEVRPVEAGNPAAPGVGVYARQLLTRYTAICQYG